jgi:hypothetical protein
MSHESTIHLSKSFFGSVPATLLTSGRLSCTVFSYPSGVQAIRAENGMGYVIVLPYHGQQVWDLSFGGKSLKMQNLFPEPRDTTVLEECYGAYMMHCGALRMGCPSPEDTHTLHGELPLAPYQKASVILGENEKGRFLGITGEYHYIRAFADTYCARPVVRLYENSTLIDIDMEVENRSHFPMELMYMSHINIMPAPNGKLLQSHRWTAEDMKVRLSIPAFVKPSKEYLDFLNSLKDRPQELSVLKAGMEYDPEVVFFNYNSRADEKGFTHYMQVHEDGTADYVGYKPAELKRNVRWILINKNQKVIGLALPATAEPEGYTAEKKKGNVLTLGPKESKTFHVVTGYLDKAAASDYAAKIDKLMK